MFCKFAFLNRALLVGAVLGFTLIQSSCKKGDSDSGVNYDWVNVNIGATPSQGFDSTRLSGPGVASSTASFAKGNNKPSMVVNRAPEGLLASGIAFLNNGDVVISYHATGNEYRGRLEVYKSDNSPNGGFKHFVGALDFDQARINNVITDGGKRIFCALDTKNGPILIALDAKDVEKTGGGISYQGVHLNGASANGLLHVAEPDGHEYIYTATGGNGIIDPEDKDTVMNFDGKTPIALADFIARPGYQKTRVSGTTLTPICFQGNQNNRGKWIARSGSSIVTLHFSTYAAYSHATVQLYPNFVQQFFRRQIDQRGIISKIETLTSKNMCLLETDASNPSGRYLYICAGDKGFRSFKTDLSLENPLFTQIGLFDVPTFAACLGNDSKMYLACGTKGLQVLSGTQDQYQAEKFISEFPGLTKASVNFIGYKNEVLFIAYGAGGTLSISTNDPLFQTGALSK